MAKYRIVRGAYAGHKVQSWRWWFPFWVQCGGTSTHFTIESAERFAMGQSREVVKNLCLAP